MKKLFCVTAIMVAVAFTPALAQFGPRSGPNFGGGLDKLFGDQQTFSAVMEFQTTAPSGENVSGSGKFSFDGGKSRFEWASAKCKAREYHPEAAAHMKAMGMDTMASISRQDKS